MLGLVSLSWLLLITTVWMLIRIWRGSPGLAIASFFFMPAALIALVKNWGEKDTDIRLPFFANLIVLALFWNALVNTANEVAQYADEDAAAYSYSEAGLDDSGEEYGEDVSEDDEIADRIRLEQALAKIDYARGSVEIAGAQARIEVPAHFRFVARSYLHSVMEGAGLDADPRLMGWVVHESVDLSDSDAWFIEVYADTSGHVDDAGFAAMDPAELASETARVTLELSRIDSAEGGVPYSFVGFAPAPVQDSERHILSWVEEIDYADEADNLYDCYALRLGRESNVVYVAYNLQKPRRELCERSVRLMAARTEFAADQGYDDYSRLFDSAADFDLLDLISGDSMLE